MKMLFFGILFLSSIFANSYSAIGYGENLNEAKNDALSNLSMNIHSEVDTTFKKVTVVLGDDFEKESGQNIKISSNLPILNPSFSEPKFKDGAWKITAKLHKKTSSKKYISELKNIQIEIEKGLQLSKKRKGEKKEQILLETLEHFNKFQKYSLVARQLGIPNIPILRITKVEIEEKMADTINETGKFITTNLKIDLKTEPNKHDFIVGEELKLYIKFSKSSYFYIVNHSLPKNKKSISYLMELNPFEDGRKQFVQKVENDEVGKWISLGEFEISDPIGKEYLEIFGSPREFTKRDFPPYKYNSDENLYLLTGKGIITNFKKTRKMRKKFPRATFYFKSEN
ncbi:hypothetical protein ThvES_00003360 [Thiovulum sp. ES]|nr:hypothetical protein ThvES_00003360 [Thiovulum sp. ES]